NPGAVAVTHQRRGEGELLSISNLHPTRREPDDTFTTRLPSLHPFTEQTCFQVDSCNHTLFLISLELSSKSFTTAGA
ncbi:MAG: hypothetical protein AAFS10_19655, partial [Myxococcota bacterium]